MSDRTQCDSIFCRKNFLKDEKKKKFIVLLKHWAELDKQVAGV